MSDRPPAAGLPGMNGFDACRLAIERYRNFARWRNLWSILLFVLGASVVLFLLAAIFLLIREEWLPVALTTLGSIVSGVASKWVRHLHRGRRADRDRYGRLPGCAEVLRGRRGRESATGARRAAPAPRHRPVIAKKNAGQRCPAFRGTEALRKL